MSVFVDQELRELPHPPITKEQLINYAHASGDKNPIHIDEEFAKNSSIGRVIAHGMISAGFLASHVDKIAKEPNRIKSYSSKFKSIVYPNDTVSTVVAEESVNGEEGYLQLQAKNQHGEVVTEAEAIIEMR